MSLGRLIATLGIDSADWVQGLTKAEHQMEQFQRSVAKGMSQVAGNVAAMAVAFLSVGKAMEVFNKTVEYAGALDDLADAAGMTVESMDRLVLSYNLIGVSTDAAGKGILAFEKALVAAGEKGSKEAQIFDALGVKIEYLKNGSVNVEKAMSDAVKSMAAIQDPALRSTLAMELMGKAGKELALKMGDLALAQQLAAEQIALYGPISDEAAKAADQFNMHAGLLSDALVRVTAPAMEEVTKGLSSFRDAFNAIGPASSEFVEMIGVGLVIALKAVATVVAITVAGFKELGAAIYLVLESAAALASGRGIGGVKEAWASFQQRITETTQGLIDFNSKLWNSGNAAMHAAAGSEHTAAQLEAMRRAAQNAGKATEAAAKEAAKLDEKWRLAAEAMERGLAPSTIKSLNELAEVYNRGAISLEDYKKQELELYEADAKLIASQTALKKLQDESNKQWIEKIDNAQKALDKEFDIAKAIDQQNERLKDEIAVMGLTGVARDLRILQLERERVVTALTDDGAQQLANTYYNEREALLRTKDASEQYQLALANQADVMNSIIDYGQSMFEAMATGMKGISAWAKQAGQDLKRFLLDVLYQATLKPFIISIATAATGMSGPAQAATGMTGNLAGSISSSIAQSALGTSISSALTGAMTSASAGAFSLLGGAGGAQAAALAAQTAEFGIAGASATMGALGGAGAALSAALPVLGVALAGYMAFKMFKKKKAPHIRGYAETSGFAGAGRGGALDEALLPFIDETSGTYESLNLALGGSASNALGFGIGLDTQKGKASKIATSAMLNGQAIYNAQVGGGKTQEETDAALKQEASRVILAALQASDLPDDIAKIIDAVPAGEATQETVDKLIGLATAVAQINDAISSLDDIDSILEELADDSLASAFARQGDALREMLTEFDGSASATEALTAASGAYYDSLIQLQSQIYEITQAVDQMFADTTESILTAGRDASWMVNHLNEDAESAFSALLEATDPAKIQEYAQRINSDILKAFNLLTPEEQAAQRDYYLESVRRVDEAVGDKLKTVGDESKAAFKENMEGVKEAFISVASDMQSSANVQRDAANTQLAAARTPVTVVVDPRLVEVNG